MPLRFRLCTFSLLFYFCSGTRLYMFVHAKIHRFAGKRRNSPQRYFQFSHCTFLALHFTLCFCFVHQGNPLEQSNFSIQQLVYSIQYILVQYIVCLIVHDMAEVLFGHPKMSECRQVLLLVRKWIWSKSDKNMIICLILRKTDILTTFFTILDISGDHES